MAENSLEERGRALEHGGQPLATLREVADRVEEREERRRQLEPGREVTALEAEVSELKARVGRLKHELEDRERQAHERLEAERVRAAERESRLKEELESLQQPPAADSPVSWFGAQVQPTLRPREQF